jgi:hypothetical protein
MEILYLLCITNILLGIKLRYWFLASSFYDCLLLLLPKQENVSVGRRSDTVQLYLKGIIHIMFVLRSGSSLLESLITSIAMVVVVQVEPQQKDIETF